MSTVNQNPNVNVKITGTLREYFDHQITPNGDYESASEYVRDLVRRDKRKHEQLENEAISNMLAQSLKSPTSPIEADFFDKARAYAKEMAENKENKPK